MLMSESQNTSMSNSLLYYLKDVKQQIANIGQNGSNIADELTIEYINKIVNPYEFINTIVPDSTMSVSKINTKSNLFFELIEVFNCLELNELLTNTLPIHVGHITPNYKDSIFFLNMFRQINGNIDTHSNVENPLSSFAINKMDLIICEFKLSDYEDISSYINNLLLQLCIITNNQSDGGTSIIKIDHIFCETIVEIIIMLSSLYEKVCLVKPSISDITTGYRYLVCKNYLAIQNTELARQINETIIPHLTTNKNDGTQIVSIIANEIPYFLLTKLSEINIIIGQQQLDAYDQIINIYKNKNKQETIDTLKRKHLQKCIQWCEKNNLPHNKFIDKINIFLSST
jgi:hypothetical protein